MNEDRPVPGKSNTKVEFATKMTENVDEFIFEISEETT